jgi:hypothetical protein
MILETKAMTDRAIKVRVCERCKPYVKGDTLTVRGNVA